MRSVCFSVLGFAWMLSACGSNGDTGAAGGGGAGSGSSSASGGESSVSSGAGGTPAGSTTGSAATTGSGGSPAVGACGVTADRVRITEIDVGAAVVNNEDEVALKPLVISPIPSGGSRLGWMGGDGKVHVTRLDASDHVSGSSIAVNGNDFSDLSADDTGGVVLLTRSQDCGAASALCGTPPNPPIPCSGMYLVRFDEAGKEVWATRLTNPNTPYSDGANFIWWYAHHGRIAASGTSYAAHFGTALSVTNGAMACVDIHQGDREKVVGLDGAVQPGGWDWGCSHSGYERVIWDPTAKRYAAVCKTDNQNRIMFNVSTEVSKLDLWYSNLGNLVPGAGGYWLTTSDIEPGQPPSAEGHADVHLLQFTTPQGGGGKATIGKDIVVAGATGSNERAPHLAAYGSDRLLAAWETTSKVGDIARQDAGRKLHVQTRSRTTGEAEGEAFTVDVLGNRYQDLVAFPDGSVAFPAPGSSGTKIKILRILPCSG